MDVVLNIAGVSAWGTVDQLTHMLSGAGWCDVSWAQSHVIETAIPAVVAAGRGGHLVNIVLAGLVGLPWHAAYSASKYGLRGLSEGAPSIWPARIRVAGPWRLAPSRRPLVSLDRRSGSRRPSRWVRWFKWSRRDAEKAADRILAGVTRNRYLVYTSADIRALCVSDMRGGHTLVMRRVNVFFTRASAQAMAATVQSRTAPPRCRYCPPVSRPVLTALQQPDGPVQLRRSERAGRQR